MKEELFECIVQSNKLQEFVDRSAKVIGCPYWVLDAGFGLLAVSHEPNGLTIYNSYMKNVSIIKELERWEEYGIVNNTGLHTPKRFYDKLLKKKVLVADIFERNHAIGRLTVIVENTIYDENVQELCKALAVYLRNNVRDQNRDAYHQAFASLIRGEDTETCARVLSGAPYYLEPPYQVICFQNYKNDFLFAKAEEIQHIDPMYIPVVTGGNLYLLVSKGHPYMNQNQNEGISFPFQNLEKIASYAKQARFASNTGLKLEKNIVEYALSILKEDVDVESLMIPGIQKCIEYDQTYHTEYLKTLITYIQCGESKQKTAKRCNLHLNTIKYRLQQIENLFGLSFDEQKKEILLSLMVAEHLYQDESKLEKKSR